MAGRPDRAALVRSHFGARRFAFNWGLAHVKADLDARKRDPGHESVGWDLGALRKVWNRAKHDVAPWWATNSKECYSAGLADLAQALSNWDNSRNGHRSGRRVGFPRFKSARRDPDRVRSPPARCVWKMTGARSRCRSSAGSSQRGHPPGATPCRLGAGARVEHDAVAAVGPVVRVDRLRAAHPHHRARSPSPRCAPEWTWGCARWPPWPRSTPPPEPKPLSNMRIRPRSKPLSRRGAGPVVNFPAVSPDRAVIGQRKPS